MTGSETIEGLTRLAAALALLASYKVGRGGGWTRARQRLARAVVLGLRNAPSGKGSAPSPGPVDARKHSRERLGAALTALWLVLLLSIVGYVEFRGAAVWAELEEAGLTVVSQQPLVE